MTPEQALETLRRIVRHEGVEAVRVLGNELSELRDDRDGKGFLRDAAEAKWMRLERELEAMFEREQSALKTAHQWQEESIACATQARQLQEALTEIESLARAALRGREHAPYSAPAEDGESHRKETEQSAP